MKKVLAFVLVVMGAVMLTACGPKVKEDEAQKIAVNDAQQEFSSVEFTHTSMQTNNGVTTYEFSFGNDIGEWEYTLDGDGNITSSKETIYAEEEAADPYYAELEVPGDIENNPAFDPFNVIENLGVDQAQFIAEIADSDYYQFYDNEDNDLYVFLKGLKATLTDSDQSFLQLYMDKGTTTPYTMTYVDVYFDKDQFCEDFAYLDSKLEEAFGATVAVGYVNADGEDNQGTIDGLIEDLPGIDESDGGYAYVKYDSSNPKVELNAQYDLEEDCYRIFVEFRKEN